MVRSLFGYPPAGQLYRSSVTALNVLDRSPVGPACAPSGCWL